MAILPRRLFFLETFFVRSIESSRSDCFSCHPSGMLGKGLGSIDAVFGLIFKMTDVTRFDSTRFVNYKNGAFNSLNGWLPWQRAYFEDYCFEAIRHVSLRC